MAMVLKPGTQPITCNKCGGRGQVQVARDTPLGRVMTTATCDVCHGTGKEIKENVQLVMVQVMKNKTIK